MGKVELTDFEREYSYLRYGGSATEFMLDNPKAVQMIKEEARVVLELAEKEVKRLDSLKEHVSEDLEVAAKSYSAYRRGDDTEISYDINRYEGVIAGAIWQKQQMMKDAIDGICISNGVECGSTIDSPAGVLFLQHNTFCVGDKVKLIIIKED